MLSQLLLSLFQKKSDKISTQTTSKSSALSASQPVQSQESLNNHDLMTQGIAQIRRHEGLVLHAYTDSLGYMTIGYGRLIDKRKGGGITETEAQLLLQNDVSTVLTALVKNIDFWDELNPPRQAVLMNMSFQMGVQGLLKFSKTLALIKAGQYSEAADNMLKSLWAKQTPNRANEMAEQMRTGVWQSG
jgi:lysozyme